MTGNDIPDVMLTTIKIQTETRDRLKKFGVMGDSYDSALNKMMDELEALREKK